MVLSKVILFFFLIFLYYLPYFINNFFSFILQILLVSSSKHRDRWIVPGGGVEPSEAPDIAAEREVFEEAGVRGKLGRLIGEFEVSLRRKRNLNRFFNFSLSCFKTFILHLLFISKKFFFSSPPHEIQHHCFL